MTFCAREIFIFFRLKNVAEGENGSGLDEEVLMRLEGASSRKCLMQTEWKGK
jgi:hypothetical protein